MKSKNSYKKILSVGISIKKKGSHYLRIWYVRIKTGIFKIFLKHNFYQLNKIYLNISKKNSISPNYIPHNYKSSSDFQLLIERYYSNIQGNLEIVTLEKNLKRQNFKIDKPEKGNILGIFVVKEKNLTLTFDVLNQLAQSFGRNFQNCILVDEVGNFLHSSLGIKTENINSVQQIIFEFSKLAFLKYASSKSLSWILQKLKFAYSQFALYKLTLLKPL